MKLPGILSNSKLQVVVGAVVLYAVTAGASFMVFGSVLKNPISINTPFGNLTDPTSSDEGGTKDKACPLNGVLYTKARQDQWQQRRPLGVMVENHVDARPQLGISRSDVVYEAVAEGGITRFLVLFLCQDAGDMAPVRSARTYFIDWLSEYNAAYAHVGGANTAGPANALGQIRDYGIKDMDQFGLGYPTYWRGTDKLAPHNVHTTTKKLWDAAGQKGYGPKDDSGKNWDQNFVQWKFRDEAALDARGDQKPIAVPFWIQNDAYTVTWQYDKQNNIYKRFHGQDAHIDPLTKEQLSAKTLIVQFEVEKRANDGYPDGHLLYGTTGSGKALIFMDGKVIEGKWSKKDRLARSKFLDAKGNEIELNRGRVWIQTIPAENKVEY